MGGFLEPFSFFDQYPHMWFWQWQINFFNQISFKNVTFFLILDYIIRDNMRQYDIFQKKLWLKLLNTWLKVWSRNYEKKIVIFTLYFLKIPIFCVNFFFVGETQLEELYLLLLFYATDSWLRNISSKNTMGSNKFLIFRKQCTIIGAS